MSGHTPGPWVWGDRHEGLYGVGPDNAVLEFASYEGMWLGLTNREANARLVAAAPDLLAALKEMREACAALMRAVDRLPGPFGDDVVDAWIAEMARLGIADGVGARAEAVVAKAEGRN